MNFTAYMFVATEKSHPHLIKKSDEWRTAIRLKPEIVQWLKDNLPGRYGYQPGEMQASLMIPRKDDAALFKMMWL